MYVVDRIYHCFFQDGCNKQLNIWWPLPGWETVVVVCAHLCKMTFCIVLWKLVFAKCYTKDLLDREASKLIVMLCSCCIPGSWDFVNSPEMSNYIADLFF